MIQLIYTSCAERSVDSRDIFKIIEVSAKNNARDYLTGFLIFTDQRFFQLIEGPDDAIETLLNKLSDDPRHTQIEILKREAVEQRAFPKWSMKRLMPNAASLSLADEISGFADTSSDVKQAVDEFLKSAQTPSTAD